jgi:hypothetical protein
MTFLEPSPLLKLGLLMRSYSHLCSEGPGLWLIWKILRARCNECVSGKNLLRVHASYIRGIDLTWSRSTEFAQQSKNGNRRPQGIIT